MARSQTRSAARRAAPGTAAARAAMPGQVVLVLQGGGALGAYQLGVYQALHEAGVEPDWVIGTSIGAINAALIAGNRPADRLARMQAFWQNVQQQLPGSGPLDWWGMGQLGQDMATVVHGIPSFFKPNPQVLRGLQAPLGVESAAYYDTRPLADTLASLVDWGCLADAGVRLTVGAVQVRSGAMHYFDSARETLGTAHIMASCALPPAFPAVRIDGEAYWDGGIYSNTPIEAVLDDNPRRSSLIFAVNVWHQSGPEPESIMQVMGRQKDIQFASRADSHIARQKQIHHLRHVIRELAKQIPPSGREDPHLRALQSWGCATTMQVAHLKAPRLEGESFSKDIDFTSAGLHARRAAGHADALRMLQQAPWTQAVDPMAGVVEYSLD
jgi:NTE family protein